MKSLDRFKLKMSISGNSLREENIFNSKRFIEETFEDDASFSPGVYMWVLGENDYGYSEQIKIRIFKREFSAANGVRMKFQSLYNTPIIVGDVLYNSKSDEYYICTESFDIDGIHWQGRLTLCNWILRWQNKQGEILEYPCYDTNTTQYNSGEQSNKQFTIGSSQHMITLPYDMNTVVLKTPQRFFLDKDLQDPTTFIVTQTDATTHNYGKKGLVKLTVTECAIDRDRDRIDLGICDYIDVNDIKTDNYVNVNVAKSIISYKTPVIKSGGDIQSFYAKFFDGNNVEMKNIVPKWNIICPFEDALIVKASGNKIDIGIDDDRFIDEEFKLVLSDDRGHYTSSLIIRVESLL